MASSFVSCIMNILENVFPKDHGAAYCAGRLIVERAPSYKTHDK